MTIVAWSGTLDKAWPTLILATTAAASGMDVAVFFTFWGLRILQKNDKRITGRNWKQRMLSVFNRGGTDHLGLSKLQMAGMGPVMMRQLAKEHKVAEPHGAPRDGAAARREALALPDDDGPDGPEARRLHRRPRETVGAATAIQRMSESEINLFI